VLNGHCIDFWQGFGSTRALKALGYLTPAEYLASVGVHV